MKETACLRYYFTAKSLVSVATEWKRGAGDIRYTPQKLENTKIKFYIRMILLTVFVVYIIKLILNDTNVLFYDH